MGRHHCNILLGLIYSSIGCCVGGPRIKAGQSIQPTLLAEMHLSQNFLGIFLYLSITYRLLYLQKKRSKSERQFLHGAQFLAKQEKAKDEFPYYPHKDEKKIGGLSNFESNRLEYAESKFRTKFFLVRCASIIS